MDRPISTSGYNMPQYPRKFSQLRQGSIIPAAERARRTSFIIDEVQKKYILYLIVLRQPKPVLKLTPPPAKFLI